MALGVLGLVWGTSPWGNRREAPIAAGAASLTGVQAWLAAILLTIMYASFTPLVHVPMRITGPRAT
jgi:hypothetical protein